MTNRAAAPADGQVMPSPRSGVQPATVLVVIGGCSVVLGGLVAAVTGPLDLARGSWLAAYLVLVGGVAQYAMGHARNRGVGGSQGPGWGWAQIGGWNLGNVLVIGGTLTGRPLWVDLGSVLLVIALVIALHAARWPTGPTARQVSPLLGWSYRILLLVLAFSIPVGIVLSHLRHS